jgi:internalin A
MQIRRGRIAMSTQLAPIEVFCSYDHDDEDWRHKVETHLSPLRQQRLISVWHDRLIMPGTNWANAIDDHLERASIILLLVSADFFASDYCYGIEMKRALERQKASEAVVIPILVRFTDWKDTPFASLQALPSDAKPIESWRSKDQQGFSHFESRRTKNERGYSQRASRKRSFSFFTYPPQHLAEPLPVN